MTQQSNNGGAAELNHRIKDISGQAVYQAYCHICGKPMTVQRDNRHPLQTSLGSHIVQAHGVERATAMEIVKAQINVMKRERTKKRLAEAEERSAAVVVSLAAERERQHLARLRSTAHVTLSSDDIDEIQDTISSLIGMMEPYYSQCDGGRDGGALIAKLESRLMLAARAQEASHEK